MVFIWRRHSKTCKYIDENLAWFSALWFVGHKEDSSINKIIYTNHLHKNLLQMDNCFADITVEFLAVVFHGILYHAAVYPASVFETRRKYSVVVYHAIHPEVNQYIDMCLKSIAECLKSSQLSRIEFALTNSAYVPLIKFVFDFEQNDAFDETADAYLVQCEQNLRAFCLKLSSMRDKFEDLPEDCSFTIYLHTNESTAVSIASNPDLESFPLVEVNEKHEVDKIVPIRRFSLRSYNVDAYVEFRP